MTDSAPDPGCPNAFVSSCRMAPAQEIILTLPDRISSALSSEQGPGWAGGSWGWLGALTIATSILLARGQHRGALLGPADRLQPSGWSESQERDRAGPASVASPKPKAKVGRRAARGPGLFLLLPSLCLF